MIKKAQVDILALTQARTCLRRFADDYKCKLSARGEFKNYNILNKRGQVTLFIIIGVVLVASVVLFFAFRGEVAQDYSISETGAIQNFVETCVDEVSVDVLERIGLGGGYYFVPENSVNGVTVYSLEGIIFLPLKLEIENEISQYVAENLFFCVNNFADFTDVEIEQGNIEVTTTVGSEEVNLDVSFPISVSKGENIDLLNNFDKRIPVRLGTIYDSLEKLVEDNKDAICLTCLLENDLKLNISNLGDNNFMFSVVDDESKLNEKSYEWDFAISYENE